MEKEQPLGEQSTLLNEDFGEIIGAVFANLFAELGFNVATHKSHQRRGPERTSLRSGTESEPEAETGWDSYHRKWSDKFLEDYKAGNLTPKQYEKLESFAKKGWNDRGVIRRGSRIGSSIYKPREPAEAWEFAMREMEKGSLPAGGESELMFQIYKSKHGDPRHGVPKGTEGIKERKITKKQLKRIIQEEIGRALGEEGGGADQMLEKLETELSNLAMFIAEHGLDEEFEIPASFEPDSHGRRTQPEFQSSEEIEAYAKDVADDLRGFEKKVDEAAGNVVNWNFTDPLQELVFKIDPAKWAVHKLLKLFKSPRKELEEAIRREIALALR